MTDLRLTLAGMAIDGTITDYYIIQFERRIEAAAMLAALSRFLNSPPGDLAKRETNPVEIRGHASGLDGIDLYLNSAALAATRTAFLPLPQGCILQS